MKRRAIYTGSFDPVTWGHLDIVRRGSRLFDELIVGIAGNSAKDGLFTPEERAALMTSALRDVPDVGNVTVETFAGLTVAYAHARGCQAILRGMRTYADFEYEFSMALTNRNLFPGLETIYVMTSVEWSYISSRLVQEVARLGGEVNPFVPPAVAAALALKFPAPPKKELDP